MNSKIIFAFLTGINLGVIWFNIPSSLNQLMTVYEVSYTRISVLISALFWSHAVMQIPSGITADRIGLRRTLLFSLLCICSGNLLPAILPDLKLAILGRVIVGVGTGLGFVSIMKLIALYAPSRHTGAYQAFFACFFSLGSIFAYLLIPHLLKFSWRWTYLMPAGICLPLLAMLATLQLKPIDSNANKPLPLVRVFSLKEGWILGCYHAISFGSMICLGNWVPSYLAEVWSNSSAMQLAWGGALVMLISGLGRLLGGVLLLKLPPLKIANGSILILSIFFFGLFAATKPGIVLGILLLAAWFSTFNYGAIFHLGFPGHSHQFIG